MFSIIKREASNRADLMRVFDDRREYWIRGCGVVVVHNDRAPVGLRRRIHWYFDAEYATGSAINAEDGRPADGWMAAR